MVAPSFLYTIGFSAENGPNKVIRVTSPPDLSTPVCYIHGIKHSPFFRTSIYILNRALFQALEVLCCSHGFPETTLLRKAFTKIQIQRRVRDSIMAKASLDVVTLVRLDSKSTPRVRSFRERAEVCLLCVCDACADRCAFESALSRARQLCCRDPLGSQKHVGMHAPLGTLGCVL